MRGTGASRVIPSGHGPQSRSHDRPPREKRERSVEGVASPAFAAPDPEAPVLHSTFVPIALLAGAALLPAQSDDFRLQTVLPARARLAEGNDSSQFPFGGAPRRIQIAYGRDTLDQDGPVAMRGIAFRPDGPLAAVMLGSWNVSVDVSTCPGSPTQLSRTFDDNHGPDRSQVFNGLVQATPRSLGAPPHRSEVRIYFFPTFTWEPRCGPLLLDFRVQSASGAALFCDAVTDGSESYGLIANTSSAGSTTANYPASGVDRRAPVLDLLIDTIGAPSVIAHPAGSALPWNIQPNTGTRAMYVYGPAAVGFSEARRITRLGWRIPASATHRARVYDIKVSLSTGAPNLPQNMSTTFGQNHGNDEMVVYDGLWQTHDFSATASVSGFEASIPLMREFEYDPELGSLVVDLQVRSLDALGPLRVRVSLMAVGRPRSRLRNAAAGLA